MSLAALNVGSFVVGFIICVPCIFIIMFNNLCIGLYFFSVQVEYLHSIANISDSL